MCGSPRQPKQPEDYAEFIRRCQVQAAMNAKNVYSQYSNDALYQWAMQNSYVEAKIRKKVIGLPLITSTEKWR